MACGTPVVATGVSGVPEVIDSSDLGIMVEQCVDSIVNRLELALSKRWDREAIARFAQRRTSDVVAKEVEQHLATACAPAAL
jgi:glycosyltransferase involved in cell wall biosynthesis